MLRIVMGALLAAACLGPGAGRAQPEAGRAPRSRPQLRAGVLPTDFHLDGRLEPREWAACPDSIADLRTIEPEEDADPAGRTVVKVYASPSEIVVGVRCFDADPQGIVSFSKERDSPLDEEDSIVLVFDTFLDGRSGYVFAVNPSGARFDGLIAGQGEDASREWDAIWEAKTSRDAEGWSAEIRIPIQSLAFGKDLDRWGFNVQRRVQRLQETSRWSGINIDTWIVQTRRAGLLVGLPRFDLGHGLTIRTSVVGRVGQPGINEDTKSDSDVSLDVSQKLGPNLLSSLTVNTDFAETEVDIRQLNLTRFPIFFPEKRSFFLEGSDIFEFGAGLDEELMLPYFSRRIGLYGIDEDEQRAIPINAGGQIGGRIGETNLGALVVNTRKVTGFEVGENLYVDIPQTTMGAVRVSQNVFEESSVGFLASFGDQLDRRGAWSAGLDFTYETSSFLRDKNFLFGVWGLLNDRDDLSGDKAAHGFRIDFPNDLIDTNVTSIHLGNGFDPSLGFVPRNNVHIWDFGLEVNPRPRTRWLRQTFYEFSFTLFTAPDMMEWESYSATVKPFDWLLESGDRFDAGVEFEGDRPPKIFEIASDVDLLPSSFQWTRYFLGARTAEKRRVGAEVRWDFGNYYSGDLSTIEARLTLKPSALWALELTGERSTGRVRAIIDDYEEAGTLDQVEKPIKEELYGVRGQLNLTPDLQLSTLTQYDTQSRELGTNNRLRWTFDPLGDLFIVYNHNLARQMIRKCWHTVSNELPIKVQYARRF